MSAGWKTLGVVAPGSLLDARLQLHWAAQLAAAPGTTLSEAQPDFGHLSLTWDAEAEQLVGERTATTPPVRAALVPASLSLRLLGEDDATIDELALSGRTLSEGLEWLAAAIGRATGSEPPTLRRPEHELPEHAVASGARFTLEPAESFAELGRWFGAAHLALTTLHSDAGRVTPIRCWPHHFDIAFLVSLDEDANDETARSVNLGLSPGDGNYAEPYFYVTPWPAPDADALPPLGDDGHWHTEGWIGAIFPASRVVHSRLEAEQSARVLDFLSSGLNISRSLLE